MNGGIDFEFDSKVLLLSLIPDTHDLLPKINYCMIFLGIYKIEQNGTISRILEGVNGMKANRLVWGLMIACALLVIWNGYTLNQMAGQIEKQDALNQKVQNLQERLEAVSQSQDALLKDKDELLASLNETQKKLATAPQLQGYMMDRLKAMGVDEPQIILEDLLNQSDLIPYEGVLGGSMFVSEAWVLTDQYAMATFEDGHVMGTMLLEYQVDSGAISWKVVASNLDD